ncbi:MAG: type II toxin-antitoxin system RelE/ParE family toxin [bacterium]|nr:type II toxin-antitoxin system RelE/ParE family toxin [bacterium]MBU1917950.1 type II toxin-antitoxin system RelE/ParE family toxin [bacterium]
MKSQFKLIWTDKAANDLRQILSFIQYDKLSAATAFVKKIKKGVEKLRKYPQLGRIVPELCRKDIREIIVKNYRVVYKTDEKKIIIITIFEGHKEFNSL